VPGQLPHGVAELWNQPDFSLIRELYSLPVLMDSEAERRSGPAHTPKKKSARLFAALRGGP